MQMNVGRKHERYHEIDTEIIPALVHKYDAEKNLCRIKGVLLSRCVGIVATAIALPKFGKLVLLSNNGSLYYGVKGDVKFYASEEYPLTIIGCENIEDTRWYKDIRSASSKHAEIPVEDRRAATLASFGLQKNSERKAIREQWAPRSALQKMYSSGNDAVYQFDADKNYCHNYTIANNRSRLRNLQACGTLSPTL